MLFAKIQSAVCACVRECAGEGGVLACDGGGGKQISTAKLGATRRESRKDCQ